MKRKDIPADLLTLGDARPGKWVAVDATLSAEARDWCARHALGTGTIVRVRDVGPEGVTITQSDGTDLRIGVECAGHVQVEPVDDDAAPDGPSGPGTA